jgi:hypothetical protein
MRSHTDPLAHSTVIAKYLLGEAVPYGHGTAAIWVP